jgi:hypothetical protein
MSDGWGRGKRPVTIIEMALAFGVRKDDLESLVRRHAVNPTFFLEDLKLYGPEEVWRIYRLVRDHDLIADWA